MRKNIIMFLLLFISNFAFSQVGINTEEPNTNTLLHISERLTKSSDPNNIKGVIIPRLTDTERDNLTKTDSNINLGETENSLMIFNTSENCYNYWDWAESRKEWKSLCGGEGNAIFTIACEDVVLNGNYVIGDRVGTDEYITITIKDIEKIGYYYISVTPTDSGVDYGYSFVASGTFASTGTHIIKLYAQGIPTTEGKNTFTINSSSSSSQQSCTVDVNVNQARAVYTINCQSTIVNGEYYKGTELNEDDNTIQLTVNVNEIGSYKISTIKKNGVIFSASGDFIKTGSQNVILKGSGAPTTNNDFDVTIKSNTTAGNATCSATIPIILPTISVGIIGTNYDWSWNTYRKTALLNKTAFGPSGKVQISSINVIWYGASVSQAIEYLGDTSKTPDIILYYAYGAAPTDPLSNALANYTKRGGILVYGTADKTAKDANKLLTGIYGDTNPPIAYDREDISYQNDYQINNIPNDPIVNGPFGDLSSKYWGEDNGGSVIVSNIPNTAVQIASAHNPYQNNNINPDYSIIWYDSSHNFVYVGDSTGSANQGNTSNYWYPAIFNSDTGLPVSKAFGHWSSSTLGEQFVYNAHLDFNILAWALERAAEVGITQH